MLPIKILKFTIVILIILCNLVWAQPSFADRNKFSKNPEYIEISTALNELYTARTNSAQTEDNQLQEEIENKITDLEFAKYMLEIGVSQGQCTNKTGKTLAIYARTDDDDDGDNDDDKSIYENRLYFLANNQTTKEGWDCEGFYLANDVTAVNLSPNSRAQKIKGPVAVKVIDGTELVVTSNCDTGGIEFNAPLAKVFKPGEVNWFIPNIFSSWIDARWPNAPINGS